MVKPSRRIAYHVNCRRKSLVSKSIRAVARTVGDEDFKKCSGRTLRDLGVDKSPEVTVARTIEHRRTWRVHLAPVRNIGGIDDAASTVGSQEVSLPPKCAHTVRGGNKNKSG